MTADRERSRTVDADQEMVRASARRLGQQIGLACAGVAAVVVGLALVLNEIVHEHSDPMDLDRDRDALLRDGILLAGLAGVLLAGLVGFLLARRAVRPLGQALALQRRFVADAGHELRTPLTILHTRAQLLDRRIPADDPSHQLVDQLLADSRVLGEIVTELLDASQVTADPAAAELLDPAAIAADVAASAQALADAAQVDLRTELTPELTVAGARTALRRAVLALTDNAISHTPPGGTVTVRVAARDDEVVIEVDDTGEGLNPADAAALTARFVRQGNTAGAGGRRFGLGLSLVREIATAHGGRLEIAGSPGHGARVGIVLPLR